MAKVISTLFISADGVAEVDPAWHFPYFDENMGRAVNEDYAAADVMLLGRVTYDSFAGAWPEREKAGDVDASYAAQLGDTRKIVVSRQPLEFTWRESELLQGNLVEAVAGRDPHPDLLDGTRAMELTEALGRSLRRGRTIDLHYEEISEAGNFKAVMTSLGCALIVGILVALPIALVGPAFGIDWTLYIAYAIPPVLILFALLQMLRLALRERKES